MFVCLFVALRLCVWKCVCCRASVCGCCVFVLVQNLAVSYSISKLNIHWNNPCGFIMWSFSWPFMFFCCQGKVSRASTAQVSFCRLVPAWVLEVHSFAWFPFWLSLVWFWGFSGTKDLVVTQRSVQYYLFSIDKTWGLLEAQCLNCQVWWCLPGETVAQRENVGYLGMENIGYLGKQLHRGKTSVTWGWKTLVTWGNSCTEGKRQLPGDGKHWLPGETVAQGRKNIAVGNPEQDSFWLLKQARCLC